MDLFFIQKDETEAHQGNVKFTFQFLVTTETNVDRCNNGAIYKSNKHHVRVKKEGASVFTSLVCEVGFKRSRK